MSYTDGLARVVEGAAAEIRQGLELARVARDRARLELLAREREVTGHEFLLELLDAGSEPQAPMTLHAAMAMVLADAPARKLRPAELLNEVNRRGLYRMRDGRTVELQQIHARVGNYASLFTREGPFIRLVD